MATLKECQEYFDNMEPPSDDCCEECECDPCECDREDFDEPDFDDFDDGGGKYGRDCYDL